jgi:hypothetical protein
VKSEYTDQASNFHRTQHYRVMQVLICDKSGRYPGEEGCDEPFAGQPVMRGSRDDQ